ncbi:MAG: hypothetical protein KDB80_11020 [Planctomycetes bacterium]|nr:hypothetical protein [Planctomycetota bacterium]
MHWRPRVTVRATDRGLTWAGFWISVGSATACYGAVILSIFIYYHRFWALMREAWNAGEDYASPDALEVVASDFHAATTGFASACVCFTVAASVAWVGLLRGPTFRGPRYSDASYVRRRRPRRRST